MIQAGDKFTVRELRQSVDEVVGAKRGLDVSGGTPPLMVLVDDKLIDMLRCPPELYAQYRIEQYGDIKSSAVRLDNQLWQKGFYTTSKFSYKYHTPGLQPDQIVKDAYCLEHFQHLILSPNIRRKHQKQVYQLIDDAFRVSYYYAQYLWACNPRVCGKIARQLSCPGVDNWPQIIGAILGVGFGFHPNDVYEFSINHINPDNSGAAYDARYAAQKKFKDNVMAKYGIDTGCLVLSPESQHQLIKILNREEDSYLIQLIKKICAFNAR